MLLYTILGFAGLSFSSWLGWQVVVTGRGDRSFAGIKWYELGKTFSILCIVGSLILIAYGLFGLEESPFYHASIPEVLGFPLVNTVGTIIFFAVLLLCLVRMIYVLWYEGREMKAMEQLNQESANE